MPEVDTSFVVVIPARYASARLPGKPLADIAGIPMVVRVYQQAVASGACEVLIATDDERIAVAAEAAGAAFVMTTADHASGTDRIAEVARLRGWADDQIVVNVQGDEPLIPPPLIAQVAQLLAANEWAAVATLSTPFAADESPEDVGFAKVVADSRGRAMYFSRSVIPGSRDGQTSSLLRRHVGIYAYRVAALQQIAEAPICKLEEAEKLEQLRCLYLGMPIVIADACAAPARGVDTPEDLAAVRTQIERRQ